MDDLSIGESEVLNSPTIIVLLSISPFMSVNICFMYLGAPMLGTYIFTVVFISKLHVLNTSKALPHRA